MTTVVVQRGHVPRTSGATGAPGEQQFAIDTAAILKPLLVDMGFSTRVINADESMSAYRGDIFVAIHYDSGAPSATGASVGYQSQEGARLAKLWKESYAQAGWRRGFRNDNYTTNLAQYYGVANAIRVGNKAAIITESGFHSNTGDDAMMTPYRTAISIADAIAKFTGKEIEDMPLTDADIKKIWDYAQAEGDSRAIQYLKSAFGNINSVKYAVDSLEPSAAVTKAALERMAAMLESVLEKVNSLGSNPGGGATLEEVQAEIQKVMDNLNSFELKRSVGE